MKAALYEEFGGPVRVTDVSDPAAPGDGVVIQVGATGVCRSDWHGWMGHDPDVRVPHVPGHELAGTIVETGPGVSRFERGDRVTVPFAVGCGTCQECRRGNHHICDDHFQPGFTAWGSFAERVAIPHADENLVRLPDEIDFVGAATLGCRFITAFRGVVAQGKASAGRFVAVHGCGGVGLSAVMIAKAVGASVIGIDRNRDALQLARDLGAEHVFDAGGDIPEAVRDVTGGGADVSIDALGGAETCRNSILCLRKGGRHVQIGLLAGDDNPTPLPMDQVIARELEIVGSHGMPAHAYGPLLDMITRGELEPKRLVRRTVDLEGGVRALTSMNEFRDAGVTVIDRFA